MPKLFFSELAFTHSEEVLKQLLEENRLSCERIKLLHRGGLSLGHGFIVCDENSAGAILKFLNGYELDGRKLKCEAARENSGLRIESKTGNGYPFPGQFVSAESAAVNSSSVHRSDETLSPSSSHKTNTQSAKKDFRKPPLVRNTLYVGNLPVMATDTDLLEIFEGHNPTTARIMTDTNGVSRGFGFVEFDDDQAAHEALEAAKGTNVSGNILTLRLARKPRDELTTSKTTLFVARLPFSLEDDSLRVAFERFHPTACHFIRPKGDTNGYGFVEFASAEEAMEALEYAQNKDNNFNVGGYRVVIEYSLN